MIDTVHLGNLKFCSLGHCATSREYHEVLHVADCESSSKPNFEILKNASNQRGLMLNSCKYASAYLSAWRKSRNMATEKASIYVAFMFRN